jgi:uncharacterized membrane protein
MKRFYTGAIILIMALSFAGAGCTRFLGGAAVGAAGAGAAYEYQNHRQMERLEEDFKAGRISKEEYLRRKEEISKGSLIY